MVVFTFLGPGQALVRGGHLKSPNGQYILSHGFDGQVAIYRAGSPNSIWDADTINRTTDKLVMQADGNFVLYDVKGNPLWLSDTAGKGGQNVYMQDDGNLVMYKGTEVVWTSKSGGSANNVSRLNINEMMSFHGSLVAGDYTARLTDAGNLAIFKGGVQAWASENATFEDGSGGKYLVFQNDGNLVIYGDTYEVLWQTGTARKDATYAVMQEDGNFCLYTKDGSFVWQTGVVDSQP